MDRLMAEQLGRQSLWLRDSWLWLLREKVVHGKGQIALEVGCGAGHVMDIIGELANVRGVDNDPDMVSICLAKGLDVRLADAGKLPFEDCSFDIVYCSFLLLWLEEPAKALVEMARVSRKWVICLAEPDYGGRLDYPPELEGLGNAMVGDLLARGADPFVGRKLRALFAEAGMDAEIGIHQGVWPSEKLRAEAEGELAWAAEGERNALKEILNAALDRGEAFQFNPVFYAIARKG